MKIGQYLAKIWMDKSISVSFFLTHGVYYTALQHYLMNIHNEITSIKNGKTGMCVAVLRDNLFSSRTQRNLSG